VLSGIWGLYLGLRVKGFRVERFRVSGSMFLGF
jgi:hypothetical protein